MAIHPSIAKEAAVRKGRLVQLFEEHGFIDEFVAQHWPNRNTDRGKARHEQFKRRMLRNEKLLSGEMQPDDEEEPPEALEVSAFSFPWEAHLRDFIAANLRRIRIGDRNLTLYTDPTGRSGVEYPTAVGPIDILAVDQSGGFHVFELKLDRGPDRALGQLARYMGWVKLNLAKGVPVVGIVVANTIDQKLKYAASVIPEVVLLEYVVEFDLRNAEALSVVRGG
jgi:hypothetical protein